MAKRVGQFLLLTVSMVLAFSLWGCGGGSPSELGNSTQAPVEESQPSVPDSTEPIEMNVGEEIGFEISDSIFETDEIVWSSSNSDIAVVNSSGIVTAVAEGKVTISATTSESEDRVEHQLVIIDPIALLSDEAPTLSEEDIVVLVGTGDYNAAGHNYGTVLGSVAAVGEPRTVNDYGNRIIPIFSQHSGSDNAVTQPMSIDINDSRILIKSINSIDGIHCNVLYQYDMSSNTLTIYHAGDIYGNLINVNDEMNLYTKYQKVVVNNVPSEAWNTTVNEAKKAKTQADEYATFMQNPNQKDAYGNAMTKPAYPKLVTEVFSGLYGNGYGSAIWEDEWDGDGPLLGFTSQTIVVSSYSENIVGSISATFTNVRNEGGYRYPVGDFVDLAVLSPKEINQLAQEIAEITEFADGLYEAYVFDWDYPSTGTENVRALNLAVNGWEETAGNY